MAKNTKKSEFLIEECHPERYEKTMYKVFSWPMNARWDDTGFHGFFNSLREAKAHLKKEYKHDIQQAKKLIKFSEKQLKFLEE